MLVALVTPAFADLFSSYSVTGRNNDGDSYDGTITFKPTGQVYQLDYCCDKETGLAVEYKNFLVVAYYITNNGTGSLNVYQRAGDAWVGIYSDYGDGRLDPEVYYNGNAPNLPDPNRAQSGNPAGKYRISGTNPDGSNYTGEVEITPWNKAFDIDRTIGKNETTGTGVSFNGALGINISGADQTGRAPIGVVGLFVPDGNGFLGVWVSSGSDKLGAERWVRE